jgi:hypothetical protein
MAHKDTAPHFSLKLITLIFLVSFSVALLYLSITDAPPSTLETPAPIAPEEYLHGEEAVVIHDTQNTETLLPVENVLFEYIEVVDGCGPFFEGECLRVRSGPGTDFPSIAQLRNGVVLKVGGKVERDGMTWYKVVFDEWLRYPERVQGDWYVAADYVRILKDEGDRNTEDHGHTTSTTQRILIDRSDQKLYAYDGEVLFMEASISTGLELTPTPRGIFTIFKKTPSRYMQGPLPWLADQQYYDLPGVPWNLYFTEQGAVIHGAYWHNNFGKQYSHGCVNMRTDEAHKLYTWATLGTQVVVRD